MKKRNLFFISIIITLLFTLAVYTIDVKTNPNTNVQQGLYSINKLFIGDLSNDNINIVSTIFLLFGLGMIVSIAVLGLVQLIKRKKIMKVDSIILSTGITVIVLAIIYILFDKAIVINYRPYLEEGELAPSYPSTHTMIVTYAFLINIKYIKNYLKVLKSKLKIIWIVSIFIIIVTPVFRVVAGMHWVSDIIGGLLFGVMFYLMNTSLDEYLKKITIKGEKNEKSEN